MTHPFLLALGHGMESRSSWRFLHGWLLIWWRVVARLVSLVTSTLKNGGTAQVCDVVFTDGSTKDTKDLSLTVGCWNPKLASEFRRCEGRIVSIMLLACIYTFFNFWSLHRSVGSKTVHFEGTEHGK